MLKQLINAGPGTLAQAVALSLVHFNSVRNLYRATPASRLGQFRRHRPEMLGLVITPFVAAPWRASERFRAVIDHCTEVDALGWPLDVGDHEYRRLADLSEISPGLRLELSAPRWLAREGLLSLSLVEEDSLVFSLSFALGRTSDGLVAYIGGLQGGGDEDALARTRRLTKMAHGMRPRDLLIEAFRMLCRAYGVVRILAVADDIRVHRSAYLKARSADPVVMSYDAVWEDRAGTRGPDGFFHLCPSLKRRAAEDIRPNKRSEYRQRYAMLDALQAAIVQTLGKVVESEEDAAEDCSV
ncbi:DUF535 family protein [Sphingobium sp. CR28]|uniref:DUF535 family protein n=1 Tax=Sphingobium sp. CR28 TaxID=3400272 RepID=UPI003FEEFF8F